MCTVIFVALSVVLYLIDNYHNQERGKNIFFESLCKYDQWY